MNTIFFRTAARFVTDLCRSFYSTFYSAGSGWFILTLSIATMLFFASSSGNPTVIKAFNIIVLPWQISFLIFAGQAIRSFFSDRWKSAKQSLQK